MTEVSRIADSTAFKVAMPVLQAVLSAGAIGAFVYVVGSLGSIQMQLASYQTSQALISQRIDSLERSRDTDEKLIDGLRISTQKLDYQVGGIVDSLKNFVLTGRPK
jgi:hypothetical protein